jgi:hypothetical protein
MPVGATLPLTRREKIDNGTAICFFFGYTVHPLALPFSASFTLQHDNRRPPALMPSRRRNDEKARFDPG